MNVEEMLKDIRYIIKGIYPHELYYPLKRYGFKHIRTATTDILRACVVLSYLGMPITTPFLNAVFPKRYSAGIGSVLARLGDKNVITLLGYNKSGMLTYAIDDNFAKYILIDFSKYKDIQVKYVE